MAKAGPWEPSECLESQGFLGPDDFRCGMEITLFGRLDSWQSGFTGRRYYITGCDSFTRWYYGELGVDVGENEEVAEAVLQRDGRLGARR